MAEPSDKLMYRCSIRHGASRADDRDCVCPLGRQGQGESAVDYHAVGCDFGQAIDRADSQADEGLRLPRRHGRFL